MAVRDGDNTANLNANGTGSGADKRGEVAGATTAAIRNTARAVTAGSESANECSRFNRSFRSATR